MPAAPKGAAGAVLTLPWIAAGAGGRKPWPGMSRTRYCIAPHDVERIEYALRKGL